jgi:hypothetical protein
MTKQRQPFYRLSSLIKAKDLQRPVAVSFDRQANAYEAFDCLRGDEESFERISLVLKDEVPVGWWWPFDEEIEEGDGSTVGDHMHPIPLSMLVSANTNFYDLADTFAKKTHRFLFVINGTAITGTTSYLDLFSRLGQLCLLSLTFFLEATAEDVCLLKPAECWKALSENRRRLAKGIFGAKYKDRKWIATGDLDRQLPLLIKCTMFADKAPMLTKTHLAKGVSNSELRSVISKAEKIRNLCAHGGDDQGLNREMPQEEFSKFLHRTQNIIEKLRQICES